MNRRLISLIRDKEINCLAIVGMAKNSGKTVSFNTIVKEGTLAGLKMALVSFGRDGEEIDSLTLKKKPRIKVSKGNYFITAERVFQASSIKAEIFSNTGFLTPFGEIKIYKAVETGLIELIGVNCTSQLKQIKECLPDDIDLILIDGALDRRSSAVPELVEGVILSTGAVIENTVEGVIEKTICQFRKLSLAQINNRKLKEQVKTLYEKRESGFITNKGALIELKNIIFFSVRELEKKLKEYNCNNPAVLILEGALVDRFVDELINKLHLKNCKIVIRDGSRVFLSNRNFNLLSKYSISISVFKKIEIIAITVNPLSPYGVHLNSSNLVKKMKERLPGLAIFDLMSKDYLSLEQERRIYEQDKDR